MAILGFLFSKPYQNDLLTGRKTATVFKGDFHGRTGDKYPLCVSADDNLFDGFKLTKVGLAVVRRIVQKEAGEIDDVEAFDCGYSNCADLMRDLRGWYGRGVNKRSSVTWVKFHVEYDWDAVKQLIGGPEISFILTDDNVATLNRSGKLIENNSVIDSYWDHSLDLAKKNIWLRNRGYGKGKWCLMIPLGGGKFQKISDEKAIKDYLHIKINSLDDESMLQIGYGSVLTFFSKKEKYWMGDYLVETDVVNMGHNVLYRIGRINPLVDSKNSDEAIKKIHDFCATNGFTPAKLKGKIMEYLRVTQPRTYEALVKAGVPE